jgi:hypothetical protein
MLNIYSLTLIFFGGGDLLSLLSRVCLLRFSTLLLGLLTRVLFITI